MKAVKKRFDIHIATEGETVNDTFELDKDVTAVKGVLLTSDRDDLLYFRGTQKIELNSEELFPENYESRLLMSGINVTPHGRYYALDNLAPGNRVVKISYKDNDSAQAAFNAYRVSLYLDCVIS